MSTQDMTFTKKDLADLYAQAFEETPEHTALMWASPVNKTPELKARFDEILDKLGYEAGQKNADITDPLWHSTELKQSGAAVREAFSNYASKRTDNDQLYLIATGMERTDLMDKLAPYARVNSLFQCMWLIPDELPKAAVFEKHLEHGLNPKSSDLLHRAIDKDDVANASLLIQYGADLNAKDWQGSTPVLYCKSVESLELLLEYGADLSIKNHAGITMEQGLINTNREHLVAKALKGRLEEAIPRHQAGDAGVAPKPKSKHRL